MRKHRHGATFERRAYRRVTPKSSTFPLSRDWRQLRHNILRGERLELVPPHYDPTVDRYDHEDVIDVTARGRSQ